MDDKIKNERIKNAAVVGNDLRVEFHNGCVITVSVIAAIESFGKLESTQWATKEARQSLAYAVRMLDGLIDGW